jgi:hypothetical protein
MNFTPQSKADIARKNLLPKGWYDFEVMSAVDKTSKAGNEMIEVKLKVFAQDGTERHVFDYLMEAMPNKLFDFCESVGLIDKYHAGTLESGEIIGKAAKVKLAIDDKNEDYPPKNVAKDYANAEAVKPAPEAPKEDDDDIPFN